MTDPTSLALVKLCCGALEAKKADALCVLDVSAQSSITDYLVLAPATSAPHLRALRVELEKAVDAAHTRIVGIETADDSGWTVVDLFDVMVHLFTAEHRAKYRLERLWKDARELDVAALLAPAAPARAPRKRAAPARRKAAAPRPRRRA